MSNVQTASPTTSPAVDAPVPPSGTALSTRQIRLVFGGLMLGLLLASLDQTIVATALPTIVGDLGGLNHLSWVVTAYLLASCVSTPLWGKLGDLYGRKSFFQAAIVIFIIGSAFSGLSQNLNELIAFRAIQGLGAGGLIVGAQAIIGDIVPMRDRGRYAGVLGSVFAVSSVAGPLIGGFFTDSLTWRWVFYINLPIGAVALVVVAFALKAKMTRVQHEIDYLGAAVLSGAVVTLILLLTWGGTTYAWGSSMIVGLGLISIALFATLIAVEQRAAEPIVPLHLFTNKIFRVVFGMGLIVGFSMFGSVTYLPLFLQVVHGASATSSGLQLAPMMVAMLATSIFSGRRVAATGTYRRFPIIGTALMTLSLILLGTSLGVDTPYWQTTIFMLLLGAGLGLTMQVLLLAAQNSVPYSELGVATSLSAFSRTIGGTLGVAVMGSILNNRLAAELPKHVPAAGLKQLHGKNVTANPVQIEHLPPVIRDGLRLAFSEALHVVFLVGVPISLIAFLLALRLRETPLRNVTGADALAAEDAAAAGEFESPGAELGESYGMQVH